LISARNPSAVTEAGLPSVTLFLASPSGLKVISLIK
jgi:hypothetical protein